MLIDASHEEETRVSIVHGNRVEDFDYESSAKKQLRGNVYLAKITRVEPSLQAAFVEYGGNRHGFLAFSEIHPDYYQIPEADKKAIVAEEEAAVKKAMAERKERRASEKQARKSASAAAAEKAKNDRSDDHSEENTDAEVNIKLDSDDKSDSGDSKIMSAKTIPPEEVVSEEIAQDEEAKPKAKKTRKKRAPKKEKEEKKDIIAEKPSPDLSEETNKKEDNLETAPKTTSETEEKEKPSKTRKRRSRKELPKEDISKELNLSDELDDEDDEDDEDYEAHLRIQIAKRLRHRYQIQDVIKKRQIILIQVVKEERGNKGAALTTYLSLPGRYCVLMPNTLHGGGVSRKIANLQDRRRLKKIQSSLNMPEGMACIIRTAGKSRTKPDITRDYDYLKRMWDAIRNLTLKSIAPCLIYEEGNLIKRSIRDQYTRDIDEILVEGKKGFETAKDFMEMLMPSHAEKVKYYEDKIPLFHRYQVESQLDSMYNPTVQLKSGGYIVINPTEALVSIDVNSGRATKEQNIEQTAQKTNYEAAEEIARQLKLRDMAGLVVIDFIDMEDRSNVRSIEKKMKDCLKSDRARIQMGRISSFGLMEMSRQRLRTGVLESSTHSCPHCEGAGVIRSVESQALHIIRMIEEEGIRNRSSKITMHLPSTVAIYLLNNKRVDLAELEIRYEVSVEILIDNDLSDSSYRMNREDSSEKKEKQQSENQNSLKLGGDVTSSPDKEEQSLSTKDNAVPKKRRRRRKAPHQADQNDNKATDVEKNTDNKETSEHPRRKQRRGPRRSRNENKENPNSANSPKTDGIKEGQTDQKSKTVQDKNPAISPAVSPIDSGKKEIKKTDGKPKKPRRKTNKDTNVKPAKETKSMKEKETKPTKAIQAEPAQKEKPKKQGWWQRTFGD